ncbi:cytochrome P450 4g15-like [Macrosteles quadrilineatus]|uniref:cytochrome P450 4g15-like n=1 Tax=Macrosteles quadrilineatus TaxID=74068 RepID=UPI0023E3303A|nr:cytochrome P450 4g15-like [Macrosteles quadrilineatus]
MAMDIETDHSWMPHLLNSFVLLLVATSVLGWVWIQRSCGRLISLAKTLPMVDPPVPLLGHLLSAIVNPKTKGLSKKFLLEMLTRAAEKGMDVYTVWLGPYPMVFVQKPEDVQLIYTRPATMHKGFIYKMVEFAVGSGLLTGPVPKWKLIRRHFLPVFHGSNLEHVVPSSNDRGRQVVKILREHCSNSPTDILPLMRIPTFVNVCHLLFGKDAPRLIPGEEVQKRAVNSIMRTLELWSIRFLQPWLFPDWLFKIFYKKDVTEMEEVTELLTRETVELLKDRIKTVENKDIADSVDGERRTIIDAFISLKQADPSFNEQDFQHEVVTICAAGTNSAAVSLSSNLLALAWHPDVQEKLYEEIVNVMGDDLNRDVTSEDLKRMTYLDQVLRETWRRYTVFPYNQRWTTEDLPLSFGVLPAGSYIHVGMLGVHMNPKIYPDPDKFDPERFSAENSANRHKFSLLPFSGGPRNCIAMAYATQFLKIVIVSVVKEYKLYTNADTKKASFRFVIEAQRENGYPIWVVKRSSS